MNRRQRKKAFKKQYGFNPPKRANVRVAAQDMAKAMGYGREMAKIKIAKKEARAALIALAESRRRRIWEGRKSEGNIDIHSNGRR